MRHEPSRLAKLSAQLLPKEFFGTPAIVVAIVCIGFVFVALLSPRLARLPLRKTQPDLVDHRWIALQSKLWVGAFAACATWRSAWLAPCVTVRPQNLRTSFSVSSKNPSRTSARKLGEVSAKKKMDATAKLDQEQSPPTTDTPTPLACRYQYLNIYPSPSAASTSATVAAQPSATWLKQVGGEWLKAKKIPGQKSENEASEDETVASTSCLFSKTSILLKSEIKSASTYL